MKQISNLLPFLIAVLLCAPTLAKSTIDPTSFIGENEVIESTEPDLIQSEDVKPVGPTEQVNPDADPFQQSNPFLTSANENAALQEQPIEISESAFDAAQLENPNSNSSVDPSQLVNPDSTPQEEQVNPDVVQETADINAKQDQNLRENEDSEESNESSEKIMNMYSDLIYHGGESDEDERDEYETDFNDVDQKQDYRLPKYHNSKRMDTHDEV